MGAITAAEKILNSDNVKNYHGLLHKLKGKPCLRRNTFSRRAVEITVMSEVTVVTVVLVDTVVTIVEVVIIVTVVTIVT